MKSKELLNRTNALICLLEDRYDKWLNGDISDEEFKEIEAWCEKEHSQIEAEMTIMMLTENISPN